MPGLAGLDSAQIACPERDRDGGRWDLLGSGGHLRHSAVTALAGKHSRAADVRTAYTKRVEAERLSQEQDTDQEADAIRLGAPEIVPVDGPETDHV